MSLHTARSTECATLTDQKYRWTGSRFQSRRFIGPLQKNGSSLSNGSGRHFGENHTEILKIMVPVLTRISNASIALSCFPAAWRVAEVLALKEQGKFDYTEMRAYMPISVLVI